jgi:hypothetical protein
VNLDPPIRLNAGWANWESGKAIIAYGQATPRFHISLNDHGKTAVTVNVMDMQLAYALMK